MTTKSQVFEQIHSYLFAPIIALLPPYMSSLKQVLDKRWDHPVPFILLSSNQVTTIEISHFTASDPIEMVGYTIAIPTLIPAS